MNTLSIWLSLTRPKTLIASISPVIIGGCMCPQSLFSFPMFLCILCFALSIQITANFANDFFDHLQGADTRDRKGPKRALQANTISLHEMKVAIMAMLCIALLASIYPIIKGGIAFTLLSCFSMILAIFYTKGPKSLSYSGTSDIFAFLFFGPVATIGTYYLLTGAFSVYALIAGIAPGALSNSLLILNNLRDEKEDAIANKKTLVVRFGVNIEKLHLKLMLLVCSITPLCLVVIEKNHFFVVLASLTIVPIIPILRALKASDSPSDFAIFFNKIGVLYYLYTTLFFIGYLL